MVWTHPSHIAPALLGSLYDVVGLGLAALAGFMCFFCLEEDEWVETGVVRQENCENLFSSVMDATVKCTKDVCKFSTDSSEGDSDLPLTIFASVILAICINGFTCLAQLFIFWPFAARGRVFNLLLRALAISHAFAAVPKFIAAFAMIHLESRIQDSYVWYTKDAIQVKTLPSALLNFSTIMSFLACAMYLVASDKGAPGQPTYLEIIEEFEKQDKYEKQMSRKVSVYRPKTMSHMIIADGTTKSSTSIY